MYIRRAFYPPLSLPSYSRCIPRTDHLGFPYLTETLEVAKKYTQVYFDTSGGIYNDPNAFVSMIRTIGVERVLFGTDYPWNHPGAERNWMLDLPFTDQEKARILGENARRILCME